MVLILILLEMRLLEVFGFIGMTQNWIGLNPYSTGNEVVGKKNESLIDYFIVS